MKSTFARLKRILMRPLSPWIVLQPNVPAIHIPTFDKALQLSAKVRDALNASGQRVVLLARSGQNLTEHGLNYSHVGFAYRDTHNIWRLVHKLNDYESNRGEVYRQSIGEFFLDDPWMYRGGWVSLPEEIQNILYPVLSSDTLPVALHLQKYSVLTHPWSTKYQQSNQWVLETFALAMSPQTVKSRSDAHQWLQERALQTTTVKIGKLKRWGARIVRMNVAFDDHPIANTAQDLYETVSADGVFAWMKEHYGASDVHVVQL